MPHNHLTVHWQFECTRCAPMPSGKRAAKAVSRQGCGLSPSRFGN